MNRVRQAFGKDDSGAVAVYVAIALVVLISAAARGHRHSPHGVRETGIDQGG